jgi:hypothetical protein
MKKLSLWIGSAAIAVLALAFTEKIEGQAKKPPPPPKIKVLDINANELFNWRHACYIEAVKVHNPKAVNGGEAYVLLVARFNKRMAEINTFAQTPNQQVNFGYKGGVTTNAVGSVSVVANVNAPAKFTDSVAFGQTGAFLPPVGKEVRIVGVYSPLSIQNQNLSQFPQFLNAGGGVIPYQGTQIFLNNVFRPK